MGWRIQPLSIRDKLFCEYTGNRADSLRFSEEDLSKKMLIKAVKTQLGETKAEIEEDGLVAFCHANPAPKVTRLAIFSFMYIYFTSLLSFLTS